MLIIVVARDSARSDFSIGWIDHWVVPSHWQGSRFQGDDRVAAGI